MEGIALLLTGILAYFIIIFVYSEELYVQIITQYLSLLTVLVMSFVSWHFAINLGYTSIANVLKQFFIIMVFTFIIFNFYLILKFFGWVYKVVAERYIR